MPSRKKGKFVIYTDGAVGDNPTATGLGVIVKDEQGEIIGWWSKVAKEMTNNEAEYAAMVFALEGILKYRPQEVHFYLDSEVVVNQMRGIFGVHSRALKVWHVRACELARRIPKVTFTYIPRERNRLADALANEALLAHSP